MDEAHWQVRCRSPRVTEATSGPSRTTPFSAWSVLSDEDQQRRSCTSSGSTRSRDRRSYARTVAPAERRAGRRAGSRRGTILICPRSDTKRRQARWHREPPRNAPRVGAKIPTSVEFSHESRCSRRRRSARRSRRPSRPLRRRCGPPQACRERLSAADSAPLPTTPARTNPRPGCSSRRRSRIASRHASVGCRGARASFLKTIDIILACADGQDNAAVATHERWPATAPGNAPGSRLSSVSSRSENAARGAAETAEPGSICSFTMRGAF